MESAMTKKLINPACFIETVSDFLLSNPKSSARIKNMKIKNPTRKIVSFVMVLNICKYTQITKSNDITFVNNKEKVVLSQRLFVYVYYLHFVLLTLFLTSSKLKLKLYLN